MPANFCLIPAQVDKFMGALRSGKIDPAKLADMTSEERHQFFSNIVGEENAKGVNSLFESKLLLKNQQLGMVSWAKKIGGITPEVRRDMITRIQRIEDVLNPADQKQFLHDLAATKLGIDVTAQEAKQIAGMSTKLTATKEKWTSKLDANPNLDWKNDTDRLDYGRALVDMQDHVNSLKLDAGKTNLADLKSHPASVIGRTAAAVPGLLKSLKATLDDSAIFRQGWKTMFTNPGKWLKNMPKTFSDAWKELGGHDAMREVKADLYSRPNAVNGTYKKMGIDIGNAEEAFPNQLPEKIPGIKRLFKASESAYTGFLYRQRADIADKLIETAKRVDVNLQDKAQTRSMGKLVNSLTGRGDLGSLERAGRAVNTVFFSPKAVKANFDTLTAHQFQKGVTPFVRKQAAINTVKVLAGSAAVLSLAAALKPGSVELDPRSSDFGKIKVGNTRFDVSGGMASIVTLATRELSQSSKSSTTGVVSKLGSGFGSQSGTDVFWSFLENKLAPAASVVKDLMKGQDFNGNKPTIGGEAGNAVVPLPITTYLELKNDPNSANDLLGLIADGFGINTNTYGKSNVNWSANPTKTTSGFLNAVGNDKFRKANDEFNTRYDAWLKANPLKGAADPEKLKAVSQAKAILQAQVFRDFGYTPKELQSKVNSQLPGFTIQPGEKTPKGIINNIVTYAKAFGTSPKTAFERIFTGQRIIRTQNGAIIVQRMPLSASQNVKTQRGGNSKEMKLDHTVPLELGGSNDGDNLKLVTTDQWNSYTPVEDFLGSNLKAGKINARHATQLIKDFKSGKLTADQVYKSI